MRGRTSGALRDRLWFDEEQLTTGAYWDCRARLDLLEPDPVQVGPAACRILSWSTRVVMSLSRVLASRWPLKWGYTLLRRMPAGPLR